MENKYIRQAKEIESICKDLIKKSKRFAKENDNPHYDDLSSVLNDLREINKFLK